jgi:hypothetical protein
MARVQKARKAQLRSYASGRDNMGEYGKRIVAHHKAAQLKRPKKKR